MNSTSRIHTRVNQTDNVEQMNYNGIQFFEFMQLCVLKLLIVRKPWRINGKNFITNYTFVLLLNKVRVVELNSLKHYLTFFVYDILLIYSFVTLNVKEYFSSCNKTTNSVIKQPVNPGQHCMIKP